jgi:intein/homing endonuclease
MCLGPRTLVLKSDLTWHPIENINVGDSVVSVDEFSPGGKGPARLMRTGIVEYKNEIFSKAFLLRFEDGRFLIATPEHRFLMRQRGGCETRWRSVKDIKTGDYIRHIVNPWDFGNYEDGWVGGMIDGEGTISTPKKRV